MGCIRFAVIGCGFIGRMHAEIIRSLPDTELVGICTAHKENGLALAKQWNCRYYPRYQDALADLNIDAVAICTPTGLHHDVTLAAAKAGKHVLCEKPIDIDCERAQEMIDCCRQNNIRFGVIMQHQFDEPILLLKEAIKNGLLGHILWGASRTIWYRDQKYYSNPWRGTWHFDGGGALINQSIHYIDLMLSIMGKVHSLSAKCRTRLHQIEAEDIGIASLEFESGALGTIEGTTLSYPGLYAELAIFGERGTVIIRNDQLYFYSFQSGPDPSFEMLLNPEKASLLHLDATISDSSHRKQYQDFILSIMKNREPAVSGQDALSSLYLIKAIYRASREQKEILL